MNTKMSRYHKAILIGFKNEEGVIKSVQLSKEYFRDLETAKLQYGELVVGLSSNHFIDGCCS